MGCARVFIANVFALMVLLVLLPDASAVKNITFYATIRDFNSDHQDVERYGGSCEHGAVLDELGPDRLPIFRGGLAVTTPISGKFLVNQTASAGCRGSWEQPPGGFGGSGRPRNMEYFDEWFNDIPGHNIKIPVALVFTETSTPGLFEFDRTNNFFPVNGLGWGADMDIYNGNANQLYNYNFALRMSSQFIYAGNETFSFSGDDDVWVFVNRKLVVDLGGLHPSRSDTIFLPDVAAQVGLEVGKRYDFDFFQVERHYSGSNCLIQTTIIPTNQPPKANSETYTLMVNEQVSARFPAFDPDTATLTYSVFSNADIEPHIVLSSDKSSFVFSAPASLGSQSTTVAFTIAFSVFDGEFSSCRGEVTFQVSQVVYPPPPPPGPVTVVIQPPAKTKLSRATVALIIAGASLLVLFAVLGVVALLIWLKSRVASWQAEFESLLNVETLAENPLYKPAETEFINPLHQNKEDFGR